MDRYKRIRNLGSSANLRRGLSFVEFMGCLVAMIGGVALGATYLGVDLRVMVSGVLDKADIPTPEFLQATPSESESEAAAPTEGLADETIAVEDIDAASVEVGNPESELAASESEAANAEPAPGEEADAVAVPLRQPTEAEIRVATRHYWDQIVACMVQEAQNRLEPVVAGEELQLYDYLLQRRKGHEDARELLESLDTFAVDKRLVAHGQQLIAWHTSGMKLYDRVLELLTDGPSSQIEGPFAQSWQSASTQLRMEENLVLEKHRAIAAYLDHTYGEEAPFVPAFP